MPTAGSFNDGDLSFSSSRIGPNLRNTIGFQAMPRIFGAFRYSGIGDKERMYFNSGYTTWDRSFDLRVDVLRQNKWLPDLTIGFQDTIGTGLHSAEYLVASKTIQEKIRATVGLGWGRLASRNVITNTGLRAGDTGGKLGGLLRSESFFKGNTGAFGGIEYATPFEGLNIKLEFSSDDYSMDEAYTKNTLSSLTNYGLDYKINNNISTSAYFSDGREIGLQFNITANPKDDVAYKFLEDQPEPFYSIPLPLKKEKNKYLTGIKSDLEKYKIIYIGHKELENEFIVFIDNNRYSTHTQAIGRTLRVLSKYVPSENKIFTVNLTHLGIPISQISINRDELSYIIDSPNAELLTKKITTIKSSPRISKNTNINKENFPNFVSSLRPYFRYHLFDPVKPFYWDLGLKSVNKILIRPGLILSGSLHGSVISNFDEIKRGRKGSLVPVRTNQKDFLRIKDPRIQDLYLSSYYKISKDIYGRFTLGYLEEMYAGISAEILRSPIKSSFSYGLEVNNVKYRDSRQLFKLENLQGLSSLNGHLSGYWDTGFYDYHAQIDYGKYLAGDKGGTFTLKREFPNGWTVGGLFSLTDASFDDYGEGSFDKAIFFKIPFNPILPYESRAAINELIRPINGDGGSRVNVQGRLNGILSNYSEKKLTKNWPKIWQ